ncbi:MAG: hypothetical protein OEZ48_14180 [Candidatus Bathyarchaeota archaeon]|nr:hypothetical protein [Candidatus Bathyarchaeota archaeon]
MAKTKKEGENKSEVKYPLKTKVNAYGFLHFRNSWLVDLGWTKGTAVTIEKSPDGSITVRKAENNA